MVSGDSRNHERSQVLEDLDALKDHAKTYTIDDIRSGNWFYRFLRHALDSYTKKVDAEYFATKYPHLPADAVIDRRVALAKRYSAIEGGLTASAYSAAIIATLGPAGAASPITLPAAAMTFAADMFYTTRLQLHLAYDISVLYGHPVDLDDPEDLYDMVRVAFGVKAGEMLRGAVTKAAPEATRQAAMSIFKNATLAWIKALPVIGKYLLKRQLVKFSIPVVAVPLSAGVNYWTTGAIAKVARQVFRDKAAIDEAANVMAHSETDKALLLKTLWMVILADKNTTPEESWLLNDLTTLLEQDPEGQAALAVFGHLVNLDEDQVLADLRQLDPAVAEDYYEAAAYAAAVDHDIARAEDAALKKIAAACRVKHDLKAVKALAKSTVV
jgi:uncharacterized protein (DUF697 family)